MVNTQLAKFNGLGQGIELLQESWKGVLDPVISMPPNQGLFISFALSAGANIINTKLGRVQQGWMIIDQNAASSIYRSAPFNDKTLQLTASNPVTISLWVF